MRSKSLTLFAALLVGAVALAVAPSASAQVSFRGTFPLPHGAISVGVGAPGYYAPTYYAPGYYASGYDYGYYDSCPPRYYRSGYSYSPGYYSGYYPRYRTYYRTYYPRRHYRVYRRY